MPSWSSPDESESDHSVRQDLPNGLDQSDQKSQGKLAQFWAFRFTASKISSPEAICECLDENWITGYGFQMERGEKRQRVEHYQGTFEVNPRKRFKTLEGHFRTTFPELKFDGRDYLQPSKSQAANAYGMKEKTRIKGPWFKGDRYSDVAKETVYKVELEIKPWIDKIIRDILDAPPNDRHIWWFWEPKCGLGKTTFQKWIYQNYKGVTVSGGKAHDMKNGVVRYRDAHGELPKIVIINMPKTFKMEYFSAQGVEEVKDMFFFSGKFGGKNENLEVCGRPPIMLIFANEPPPNVNELAADRWQIVRLPDGKGKDVKVVQQNWEFLT